MLKVGNPSNQYLLIFIQRGMQFLFQQENTPIA